MTDLTTQLQQLSDDLALFHTFMNGDSSTSITTTSGSVPTVAKLVNDIQIQAAIVEASFTTALTALNAQLTTALSGITSFSPVTFPQVANSNGAQTLTLSQTIFSVIGLFHNGLLQAPSAYTASGLTVTIPGTMNVIAGDLLAFVYIPGSV